MFLSCPSCKFCQTRTTNRGGWGFAVARLWFVVGVQSSHFGHAVLDCSADLTVGCFGRNCR